MESPEKNLPVTTKNYYSKMEIKDTEYDEMNVTLLI